MTSRPGDGLDLAVETEVQAMIASQYSKETIVAVDSRKVYRLPRWVITRRRQELDGWARRPVRARKLNFRCDLTHGIVFTLSRIWNNAVEPVETFSPAEAIPSGRAGGIEVPAPPMTPPGWSYNPSAWSERWPIIALALAGAAIAIYLTLYQVGAVATVWEPFFGNGSRVILGSPVSRTLPLPDAALGATGYLVDAVTGSVGGRSRWRTMPWIAVVFGIAVGPLGAVSILLVILQPVLYHSWCSLCLLSALISVAMIGPAMDELLASLQFLRREHQRGSGFWPLFLGRAEPCGPAD